MLAESTGTTGARWGHVIEWNLQPWNVGREGVIHLPYVVNTHSSLSGIAERTLFNNLTLLTRLNACEVSVISRYVENHPDASWQLPPEPGEQNDELFPRTGPEGSGIGQRAAVTMGNEYRSLTEA